MKGRLEHTLKRQETINNMLKEMPECCTSYYYTIQMSKESKTCYLYLCRIRHLFDYLGYENVSQIRDIDIGRFFDHINTKYDNKGKLVATSSSYKKMTYFAFKDFFNYLVNNELIAKNPMAGMKSPKGKDNVNRKSLNIDEMNRTLDAVNDIALDNTYRACQKDWKNRDFLVLYMLLYTGMRESALTEINIDDIDFEEGILNIIDKRNKTHKYVLTDKMLEYINNWLDDRDKYIGDEEVDALFINRYNKRLSAKGVYRIVEKYTGEAGVKVSPHKLRASFVTAVYEASGHDLEATRQAVGHADISTTSRYIVQKNKAREKAASYMETVLTGGHQC